MTDVSTVVGYLNYMQSAIGGNATTWSRRVLELLDRDCVGSDPGSTGRPHQSAADGGRDGCTLRGQILAAVNSIAIPSGDQNAINAALANRVKTAIYLTMASPAYSAQF